MWWRSAVNLSFSPFLFLLCLAACRMRSSACVTVPRLCLRPVLCWSAFPSAPVLGSTGSATGCPALFAGFAATSTESDSPRPCIIGFGSSPSRCGPPLRRRPDAGSPGSRTRSVRTCQGQRPRRTGRGLALTPPPVLPSTEAKASASGSMVLSRLNVLAYAFPCRRFAPTLTDGQTHGLGPMWIATPSLQWTCTTYSLPVSPGAQPRTTHHAFANSEKHLRGVAFRDLHQRVTWFEARPSPALALASRSCAAEHPGSSPGQALTTRALGFLHSGSYAGDQRIQDAPLLKSRSVPFE